jgi:hypothetical protein
MPFIRGRYHINPIVGAALEAAREADEALAALHQSEQSANGSGLTANNSKVANENAKGPIHRVEIEAAVVVPPHSGSAQRGFVARIHRVASANAADASSSPRGDFFNAPTSSGVPSAGGAEGQSQGAQAPETQVFSNPQDLTDFLRNQFEEDCGQ